MKEAFCFLGVITFATMVGFMGYCICCGIANVIRERKLAYEIKHRFDKPPLAKCYCVDCEFHGKGGPTACRMRGDTVIYTPDCGFCYEAKPKKK